jgi:hypothetical protein
VCECTCSSFIYEPVCWRHACIQMSATRVKFESQSYNNNNNSSGCRNRELPGVLMHMRKTHIIMCHSRLRARPLTNSFRGTHSAALCDENATRTYYMRRYASERGIYVDDNIHLPKGLFSSHPPARQYKEALASFY